VEQLYLILGFSVLSLFLMIMIYRALNNVQKKIDADMKKLRVQTRKYNKAVKELKAEKNKKTRRKR